MYRRRPTAATSTAWNTVINFFLCPSDGNAGKGNINSYKASQGTYSQINAGSSNGNTTGVFAYNGTCYGLRDITDGSSQTVAFSENLVGPPNNNDPTKRGSTITNVGAINPSGEFFDASQPANFAALTPALQACTQAFQMGGGNVVNNNGQRWLLGNTGFSMFNTIVPPNSKQYPWSLCRRDCGGCNPDSATFMNAQSNHSGGVNVLMSDGSVKFIKDSVQQLVWMQIGTKDGNDVVSADQF